VSSTYASHPSSITLEQLTALNDEVAALVRAGVPLELGLGHLGTDMPGRLGQLSTTLANRMSRGESLPDILASDPSCFPPVYRAIVETGLRTGCLASALETVSSTTRRLTHSRQMVVTSFVYPVFVFLLAWTLFVLFVAQYAPWVAPYFQEMSPAAARPMVWLASIGHSAIIWGPLVPVFVIALGSLWWHQASRASLVQPHSRRLLLEWIPWMGPMLRSFRISAFADILALLVENEVPLPEAIRLAAEATGDTRMIDASQAMAAALQRGEKFNDVHNEPCLFPPLLSWLMSAGHERSSLLPGLRHAADAYHRRAVHQAETARVFLPVLLTVVIGGGALLVYALMVFVPWITLLHALA